MKTIWKFELKTIDKQEIEVPIDAEILSLQAQREVPCLWILVDTDNPIEKRTFEVFGTGHEMYYDMNVSRNYIDTYQLSNGGFVFHLFERL